MKANLRRPCNDCPFRRKATPGWLGSADPGWFVSSALADYYCDERQEAAPCHRTVDYNDPDWQETVPDAEVCVGALVFYRNVDRFKLPRDPDRSKLVASVKADHDVVFSTADEFVAHHERGPFKSWEQHREAS